MPRLSPFSELSEFVAEYEVASDLIGTLDDRRRVAAELARSMAWFGSEGRRQPAVLGDVDGCTLVKSTRYDVRLVRRTGSTLPGFLVSAASFPYDASRQQEAVHWATEVTQVAESLPDFNFAVVELTDGPRPISVTTWRDRDAFAAAEADLRGAYETGRQRWSAGVMWSGAEGLSCSVRATAPSPK